MITSLLKWAYAMDVELWSEYGKLKFRAEHGIMTDTIKQQLIDNKEVMIERLEQIAAAKAAGWQMFEFGEMYRKAFKSSELCIFRNDDGTYTVWRGKYKAGVPAPFEESMILSGVPFQAALERANKFYSNATNFKPNKRIAG